MMYAISKETREHYQISDTESVLIDKQRWRVVKADADGWIEWHGGECPLPQDQCFRYMTRDGFKSAPQFNPASYGWEHDEGFHGDEQDDIIAYRPILEETKPTKWRGPQDGLPPVGLVVEYLVDDFEEDEDDEIVSGEKWSRGDRLEVLAHRVTVAGSEVAVLWNTRETTSAVRMLIHDGIQLLGPIRTPEEIAEELAVSEMLIAGQYDLDDDIEVQAMERIYAAIRDGRIPGVTLT